MRHVVVMVATSYPRFPGDGVGSFMEPIAKGVAARGHEVHLVAPWHPAITRGKIEDGVHFHFYRYALVPAMNVFGYAAGLRADTHLKAAAWVAAPAALAAGWFKAWRVATKRRATVMHGHWVIPGGAIAAAAAGRLPLVVSLHGSDVFVAERHAVARRAAGAVFRRAGWVTACSDDLHTRAIALGASPARTETVPYGVDVARFAPNPAARDTVRREFGLGAGPVVFTAGRLVRKKGFEFLIEAARRLTPEIPDLRVVIAGDGDLREELTARAADIAHHVTFLGNQSQDTVGHLSAAADVVAVPSVHDELGNVDGLPNFALEAMATATAVLATRVGGLPSVIDDGVTGRLVGERDAVALAEALRELLTGSKAAGREALGARARAHIVRNFGWARVAERFEAAYRPRGPLAPLLFKLPGSVSFHIPMPSMPSPQPLGLSIFFPAYNDAGTIASLVIAARHAAQALTSDFEILVVNDGSKDATADIVDELARTYPEVRAIHHPRNRGYGGALRTGFRESRKDLVFYTDGDAQYDPSELAVLWPYLTDDVDLVNGYKISRSDPMHRVIIGRLYHHTVKLLFRFPVRDVDCDFRLMRRSIFDRVSLDHNSGVICLEMMKKIHDAGFRIAEVPVHHYHRAFGRSQFFNFRRLFRTAVDVAALWFELVVRRQHRHATLASAAEFGDQP